MESIYALEYVMGIYGLSFLVTLFVWFVIVVIRWASSESPGSRPPQTPSR
ncbi:MAG TPA: hypothetical protein VLX11_02410 [Candidatus Acidoferrales bacterium]|nr:hypothetical protein [Candidatus Acidoferrales bacterium]